MGYPNHTRLSHNQWTGRVTQNCQTSRYNQKSAQIRTFVVEGRDRSRDPGGAVRQENPSEKEAGGKKTGENRLSLLHPTKDTIVIIIDVRLTAAKVDVVIATVSRLAICVTHLHVSLVRDLIRQGRVQGKRVENG